jgi:hypothetical protein
VIPFFTAGLNQILLYLIHQTRSEVGPFSFDTSTPRQSAGENPFYPKQKSDKTNCHGVEGFCLDFRVPPQLIKEAP